MPGRHVTDQQMWLFMTLRQTHPVPVAAAKAGVSQGADDLHPPAPDAVTRRAQHLGPAAAGHRLRRLDHVTRQRDHQDGAVNPGQRRPAAA